MTIYFVIFAILVFAVFIGFRSKRSLANRTVYLIATAALIACAGLRADSVGRDYDNYRDYFKMSPEKLGAGFWGQWLDRMPTVDIGYVYLNSLAKSAGFSVEGLMFAVALISVTLNSFFFWKHLRLPAFALMLYYSHAFLVKEMIQVRDGLACAIALWAFHFWAADRKKLGCALTLLAIATHMAALVIVIPLILFELKITFKPVFVALTVIVAMAIGYNLSSAFPVFGVLDRLAQYQDTQYSASTGIFSNVVIMKELVILGLCCWLMSNRNQLFPPTARLCVYSYWVATIWAITFNQFQILGARGASFLWIGEPLIVAHLVVILYADDSLRSARRIASVAVVCFALVTLTLDLRAKEVFNDYRTIFQV